MQNFTIFALTVLSTMTAIVYVAAVSKRQPHTGLPMDFKHEFTCDACGAAGATEAVYHEGEHILTVCKKCSQGMDQAINEVIATR
jgi:transcription elongation factor Elf1